MPKYHCKNITNNSNGIMSQVKHTNSTITTSKHSNRAESLRKDFEHPCPTPCIQDGQKSSQVTNKGPARCHRSWEAGYHNDLFVMRKHAPAQCHGKLSWVRRPTHRSKAVWPRLWEKSMGLPAILQHQPEREQAEVSSLIAIMAKVISGPGLLLGPTSEFLAWHIHGLHWCPWSVITT